MKKESQFGSIAELTEGKFSRNKSWRLRLNKRLLPINSSYSFDQSGTKKMAVEKKSYPLRLQEQISWFNPTTKQHESRTIRVCNNEQSIFADEQNKDSSVKHIVVQLMVRNGFLDIKGSETKILKFIALSDKNESNPSRNPAVKPVFYIEDKGKQYEAIIQREDTIDKAKELIRNPDNHVAVMALARIVLGTTEYEKMNDGSEVATNMIKFRLRKVAEKDPDKLLEAMKNPSVLRKHYILEGIADGTLKHNASRNSLDFENGIIIQQSPAGMSPIDLFVDNIEQDRPGMMDKYGLILEKMGIKVASGKKPKEEKEEKQEDVGESTGLSEDQAKEMLDKLQSSGIVKFVKPQYFFMQESETDARTFFQKIGSRGILTALMNDKDFLEKCEGQLNLVS